MLSVVEQVVSLAKQPDFGMLGYKFLMRVHENFLTYSDQEQLELLRVLPGGWLPSYPIAWDVFERNKAVIGPNWGNTVYWEDYFRYCERRDEREGRVKS